MDTSNRSRKEIEKRFILEFITTGKIQGKPELDQEDLKVVLRAAMDLVRGHLKYLVGYEPIGKKILAMIGDKDPNSVADEYSDGINAETGVVYLATLSKLIYAATDQSETSVQDCQTLFVSKGGHFIYWTGRYQQKGSGHSWQGGGGILNKTCFCCVSQMTEKEVIDTCSLAHDLSLDLIHGLLNLLRGCIKKKEEVLKSLQFAEAGVKGIYRRMQSA